MNDLSGAPAPAASTITRLRRGRNAVLWCAVVVLGATVLALIQGGRPDTYLDPRGTGPLGIGALVSVLTDQGVDVELTSTIDELAAARARTARGTPVTVAVGASDFLTGSGARSLLATLDAADDLVLLDGAPEVLDALDLGYLALPTVGGAEVTPGCGLAPLHSDLRVDRFGVRFVTGDAAVASDVTACYPVPSDDGVDHGSLLISVPASNAHPAVIALGVGPSLTNRRVADLDHAALGLRLLGHHPRLIIHTPSITDVVGTAGPAPATAAPPAWLGPGLVLLALGLLAYAVAVGRRHGRLVPEPLPVVVRASETTHSRGELYRAAGDRARAAAVLREGTTRRLRHVLALGGATAPAEVAAGLAAHGIRVDEALALLTGPPPTDDADLVRLANALTDLEQKVTR